ncbi:MAG: glycoside hydrolase family 3 C-terminal domain-containing protein [Candidatus Onthomonas sp.]
MAKQKKKGTGVVKWSVLTAVTAVLLAVLIFASNLAFSSAQAVNSALQTPTNKTEHLDESVVYFERDFATDEELEAHDREIATQLSAEGIVLLKNANNALPLSLDEKISTLGRSSVSLATCGTGSADIDTSKAPTLKESLESEGFEVNSTLWDFYLSALEDGYYMNPSKAAGTSTMGLSARADYHVNEVPATNYTDDVRSSFAAYGDVALVTISRISGEMFDMPNDGFVDGTDSLDLTQEEKELFQMIQEVGFAKTVVLINSTNAMDCSFLEEYDVDAALWVGYTGQWGTEAIADLLSGAANPSGKLVDTYCYDNSTNPAMVGFYGGDWANASEENTAEWWYLMLDGNKHYNTYQEGIYVGYRYYETHYEDVVMGTGNAGSYDYASTVAYPFGHGLSYTDFQWSDFQAAYDAASDSFTVSVTVTNTGSVAGKEVVEIYFQSPYTDYDRQNSVEKASIELCGFDKTELLEPGASETVTVSIPREELAAYDSVAAKTYILDAGDYYLTAGRDAHDALNNVLAAKGYTEADGMTAAGSAEMTYKYVIDALDTTTYSVSSATGNPITNQFDNCNLSYYGEEDTYLSRSDWQGTWPEVRTLEANDAIIAALNSDHTYSGTEGSTAEMPTMGADNGMTLGMMIGKDYDDPDWDKLLDQATYEEMAVLIGQGYHNTAMMMSVSKPATLDDNGPQGFTLAMAGISNCHCAYTDENIMAATWNVDLMYEVGRCIGNDMMAMGATGLYGPAMNTHRTAYAGRNFEYYSEDGFLAGKIAAAEVRGIQDKGCYVYIKHFALNDSETSCRCVSTWANEQAIREIYLKPFQTAVVEGGAMCVMNSFARLGAMWSGAHYGLQTEVLRNEWGMKGFSLTDFSGNAAFSARGMTLKSFDVAHGVLAGTDSWDSSSDQWSNELINDYKGDPDLTQAMRQATHRILYTVANSHAMNGFTDETKIVAVTPWWQTALYVVDALVAVGCVACAVMLVKAILRRNKSKAEVKSQTGK